MTIKHMATTSLNILHRLRPTLSYSRNVSDSDGRTWQRGAKCDCCFSPSSQDAVQQGHITQTRLGVCRLSAPAGRQMGSQTHECPQVIAFLREEFRAPSNAQLRVISNGMSQFLCLNKDRKWLKGCEKPVYFKVRVETDTGRDASCVKGPAVCRLFLDVCREYKKPLQEMWDEEVRSLFLAHCLWGPWLWSVSESQVFLKYCPRKAT